MNILGDPFIPVDDLVMEELGCMLVVLDSHYM